MARQMRVLNGWMDAICWETIHLATSKSTKSVLLNAPESGRAVIGKVVLMLEEDGVA